jgi:restriction endonuclease S subunit
MSSRSVRTAWSEAAQGTNINNLKRDDILQTECFLPPLDEQKRIVALLDAATERVTELTACYEQARTHAELLSGSMLVELLTSVEDSEPMRLGDIAELKGRIGWRGLTAKEYTKEGPLFVSVHSLNYGHFVDLKDAFHISQDRYDESPEIMLKNNDILICKDGAGIGKLGMVGQLPGPATINSSLLLIRASKKVRSEFLYFYLLSPIFQNLVQERLSGSTTPHLYQRDIAELVIELPSLETQDHLIKKMWGALGRQGDLVECFDKQIGAMMRMRQSILEAAFAGEL